MPSIYCNMKKICFLCIALNYIPLNYIKESLTASVNQRIQLYGLFQLFNRTFAIDLRCLVQFEILVIDIFRKWKKFWAISLLGLSVMDRNNTLEPRDG